MHPCMTAGCIALAESAWFASCAVHRRTPSPQEMRWLHWANNTPRLRDCRLALVRRDPPPWWKRPFHEDNYDA